MTGLDLLSNPDVHEISALPLHRMKKVEPWMEKYRFRGIIWVTSAEPFNLIAEDHKAIPNTTLRDLKKGDYGGVFLDDGYWLVCDAKTYEGAMGEPSK